MLTGLEPWVGQAFGLLTLLSRSYSDLIFFFFLINYSKRKSSLSLLFTSAHLVSFFSFMFTFVFGFVCVDIWYMYAIVIEEDI